jgi:hypothetical protein
MSMLGNPPDNLAAYSADPRRDRVTYISISASYVA